MITIYLENDCETFLSAYVDVFASHASLGHKTVQRQRAHDFTQQLLLVLDSEGIRNILMEFTSVPPCDLWRGGGAPHLDCMDV